MTNLAKRNFACRVFAGGIIAVVGILPVGAVEEVANVIKDVEKVESVELEVRCQPKFISGKENPVEITVRNNGEPAVEYIPYSDLKMVSLQVKCQGRDVEPTELYRSWSNSSTVTKVGTPVRLEKGAQLQVLLNISRLFDFSVPGDYEITVSWSGKYVGDERGVTVKSHVLKIKVIAEAPQPLQ